MFYNSNKGSKTGETANFTMSTATNRILARTHNSNGISLITGLVVVTHGVKGGGDIHMQK